MRGRQKRLFEMTELVYKANPSCFLRTINLEFTDDDIGGLERFIYRGWFAYNGFDDIKKYINYPGDKVSVEDFRILLEMDDL